MLKHLYIFQETFENNVEKPIKPTSSKQFLKKYCRFEYKKTCLYAAAIIYAD